MKKVILIFTIICLFFSVTGCTEKKEKVVIYSSSDENEVTIMQSMLDEKFPNYDIIIEYLPTGNHAAKLKAEGIKTEADISYDLEYGYLEMLEKEGLFEKLDEYDYSKFIEDLRLSEYYLPTLRYGGAIIINEELLKEKNLSIPKTYEDLLKEEYEGLISMPNPTSSGTGYMFVKSLVNAWGEEEAFVYFDKLAQNILQFTSSGSGPVNALVKKEAVIGLGMTSHAALKISDGEKFSIHFFAEGSPFTACGTAIVKGKSERIAVREVFEYMYTDVTAEISRQLYPEQIYKDVIFEMNKYPTNIPYADMSNDNAEEKERLLSLWKY